MTFGYEVNPFCGKVRSISVMGRLKAGKSMAEFSAVLTQKTDIFSAQKRDTFLT